MIDDLLEGVILKVLGGGMFVVDCQGFEYRFLGHQLVKVVEEHELELQNQIASMKLRAKDIQLAKKERKPGKNLRRNNRGVLELDLHLHEIVEDERGIQAGEKLRIQLDYCRKHLDEIRSSGERSLVIIHGVGEGVLKNEVRELLDHLPGIRYHDASLRLYGTGATLVEFSSF